MTDGLIIHGVVWYLVFLFSVTLHEAAHAYSAMRMGDLTAYHEGQVSVSPVPHVRRAPFGMILIPLVSFFMYGGGWMIGFGHAPYDPHWAARFPRKAAWMAFCGPLVNLGLFVLAGLALKVGLWADFLYLPDPEDVSFANLVLGSTEGLPERIALFLSVMFSLNFLLFILNMTPLPPFDGGSVITLLMPREAADWYTRTINTPNNMMFGMLFMFFGFQYVFYPAYTFALILLYAGHS